MNKMIKVGNTVYVPAASIIHVSDARSQDLDLIEAAKQYGRVAVFDCKADITTEPIRSIVITANGNIYLSTVSRDTIVKTINAD